MVKLQMQLDNITHQRFKGSFHCASTLIRERGLKTMYTGYPVNTVREIAFGTMYFGLYENLKHIFKSHWTKYLGEQYSNFAIPVAGGLSGAPAWFFSFP